MATEDALELPPRSYRTNLDVSLNIANMSKHVYMYTKLTKRVGRLAKFVSAATWQRTLYSKPTKKTLGISMNHIMSYVTGFQYDWCEHQFQDRRNIGRD